MSDAKIQQRTEKLTATELRKLKNAVTGYGKLIAAAQATGLHKHTIRNVKMAGYGEPDTIQAIRSFLSINITPAA